MGISFDHARDMLAAMPADHPGRALLEGVIASSAAGIHGVVVQAPKTAPARAADGMTKLERSFWERLRAACPNVYERVYREPVTFRLAGRCRYTPDFMAVYFDGSSPLFYEVKGGFAREDSIVKLKVAAELYDPWPFVLATRPKREWVCYRVGSRGIEHHRPYCPSWLR